MLRRALVLFFLLAGGALRAEEPVRLELTTAIGMALDHNRELARQALGLRSAAYGIDSARAEFSLRLVPAGTARTDQDGSTVNYGLTAVQKFLPGTALEVGGRMEERDDEASDRSQRSVMQVGLTQPLFRDFGALVQGEAITKAGQQLRRARRDLDLQRSDLVVNVVETFESLIRLERQILSAEASFQRMDKLYRLTQARERQGRASRVDTLRVELKRGQALSRLETDRERFSFTRRDFAELLGQPPESTFMLEPPPLLEIELPVPEIAIATALSNRLDYAQACQDYGDTVRGVKIAEKALLPAVSLVTRYERVHNDNDSVGEEEDQWSVGLAGDTDLTRARERAQLGQATLSRESAQETVRIRELGIAREVRQLMTTYQQARAELLIAERNYTLANNRARLARRLFELGRGDNFSVTDAEEALQTADLRRLSARADASVTGYKLLRGLGTLVEAPEELKPTGQGKI